MIYDENKIKEAIGMALKDFDMQPTEISDAAFHMTDWLGELKDWNSFCEKPESFTHEEVQDLLMDFLVHVPNHIAAASKLITGTPVTDIFEVGATVEGKD